MSAAQYRAGAATIDITPSLREPVYMAGFAPNRTATGILHPLGISALVVDDSAQGRICLVTADLIGLLNPVVERIRDRVAHLVAADQLLVCSTHTHSGPDTLGLWGPAVLGINCRSGIDPDYLDLVVEAAGRAVEDACAALRPVRLAATSFETPPHWVRNDRRGGGLFPHATTLTAHDEEGPYAILLNFAAHPEALWENNRALSPDFPAPVRNHLRQLGWRHSLFFNGPLGAMLTPAVPSGAKLDDRVRYIEYFGRMLAELTHRHAMAAAPLSGLIRTATKRLSIANENPRFKFAHKVGLIPRPMGDGTIQTELFAARIGALQIASIPGEPSPEVGDQIVAALGSGPAMLMALGQDELGYIIPAEFFGNKEYKYEQTMSVGPHFAATVIQTIATLSEQLNNE
jgi:hypothetical protein